ncbi:MAG: STAS domain-containing protein [Woeseia sp.]
MFRIVDGESGVALLEGRLDAAQAPRAQEFLDRLQQDCALDMGKLEYISSAGLGVLLRTHKRLMAGGRRLKLVNVNRHINDILSYSGFDKLFEIEVSGEQR